VRLELSCVGSYLVPEVPFLGALPRVQAEQYSRPGTIAVGRAGQVPPAAERPLVGRGKSAQLL
jgi:hypothetical protein